MTMDMMQRIGAERACARLIAQYAYYNDERNFEALAALFTEDSMLCRPSAPEQAIVGRSAILAAFRSRPAETMTFHVCSDVIVDLEDELNARARSRILLLAGTRAAQGGMPDETRPPAPGVFRDRLRLTKDGWKFVERRGAFWVQP